MCTIRQKNDFFLAKTLAPCDVFRTDLDGLTPGYINQVTPSFQIQKKKYLQPRSSQHPTDLSIDTAIATQHWRYVSLPSFQVLVIKSDWNLVRQDLPAHKRLVLKSRVQNSKWLGDPQLVAGVIVDRGDRSGLQQIKLRWCLLLGDRKFSKRRECKTW